MLQMGVRYQESLSFSVTKSYAFILIHSKTDYSQQIK